MKQHITTKQLEEIKGEGYQKLYEWASKEGREYKPHLSIGQMIEFLTENLSEFADGEMGCWGSDYFDFRWEDELCDYLWEACKEVLNK